MTLGGQVYSIGLPIGRRLRPLFAWYGSMSMAPHLWTMVGLGAVEIVVEFHRPTSLADCGSRKALARYCQERVAAGLANAVSGRRRPRTDAPREKKRRPAPAKTAETPAPALG